MAINNITLGEDQPLSNDLKPIKVGGEASIINVSSPTPDGSVDGEVEVKGKLKAKDTVIQGDLKVFSDSDTNPQFRFYSKQGVNCQVDIQSAANTRASLKLANSQGNFELRRDSSTTSLKFTDGTNTPLTLDGDNVEFTNLTDGSITIDSFVDEDNMSSNSATKIPTQQSVKAYVDNEVAGLVDSAPAALDTLNELAAALNDDASFSTTVTNSLATKVSLTGNETITGQKTFSQDGDPSLIIQDPNGSNLLRLLRTDTSARFDISLEGSDLRFTPNTTDGTQNVLIGVNAGSSTIDSRLGVGNATPAEMLDVTGNAKISGDLTVDTSTLKVDSSNNRVGIGTTSPSVLTHISADGSSTLPTFGAETRLAVTQTGNTGGYNAMTVLGGHSTGASIYKFGDKDDEDIGKFIYYHEHNRLDTFVNGSQAMSIDSSGNVGIGTDSPDTLLHLASSSGDVQLKIEADTDNDNELDNPQVLFAQDGGAVTGGIGLDGSNNMRIENIWSNDAADVVFHASNAEKMRITGTGNVGIGVTSPDVALEINGGSGTDLDPLLRINKDVDGDGSATGILIGAVNAGQSKSGIFFENKGLGSGRGNLYFCNDNTADNSDATIADARMTITNTGNVGIGTTSPTEPLEVYSANSEAYHYPIVARNPFNSETNLDFGVGIKLQLDDGSENKWASIAYEADSAYGNSGDLKFYVDGYTNSTPRMTLQHEGKLGIGTTSPDSNLHIKSSSATQPVLQLETALDGGGADTFVRFGDSTEDYSYALGIDDSSNTFRLAYNGSSYNGAVLGTNDLLTVTTAGNVGIGTTSPTTTLDVNGTANFSDDVTLPDGKKIILGNGNDMQIQHNGSNSVVGEFGTGDLSLQSNGAKVSIYDAANGAFMAKFNTGAGVELLHNGTEVFETTSTGVNIEGTVSYKSIGLSSSSDAFDVSGATTVTANSASGNIILGGFANGVSGQIIHVIHRSPTNSLRFEHNEATATQPIYTSTSADKTLSGYGGMTLFCDGNHWFEIGN